MTLFISSSVGDQPHQPDIEFNCGEADKGSSYVNQVIESLLEDAHADAGEISYNVN